MIRAIYQWQVKLGYENVFVKAWVQGTKAIRAAGSFVPRTSGWPIAPYPLSP